MRPEGAHVLAFMHTWLPQKVQPGWHTASACILGSSEGSACRILSKCTRAEQALVLPNRSLTVGCMAQIFLRGGQMAQLDKMRTELMGSSAVTLQRFARGFLARRRYLRTRRAIVTLQAGLPVDAWPAHPLSLNEP